MAALAQHMSLRSVGQEYQCAPSTVSYQLKKLADSAAIDPKLPPDVALANKKRCGRPRTWSKRDERAVVKVIRRHKFLKPQKVLPIVVSEVKKMCLSTLRAIMRENDLHRYQSVPKPYLSPLHRRKRLAYVRRAIQINPEAYICIDETPLHLGYFNRPWVTCKPNERHKKDFIISAFKKQLGFMVWAAIWVGGHSELVRFDCSASEGENGGVTSAIYVDQIYSGPLRRIWRRQRRAWARYEGGPLIIEDNSSVHTGKITKAARKREGFKMVGHPPSSPDLNPIEYAWSYLKDMLDALPDRPRNLDELWEAAQTLWNGIPQGFFDKYILGLPDRMEKVRKARGGHPDEEM